MTQYYVDEQGIYLGGFEGVQPPQGSIEVPYPPEDTRQRWNGGSYGPLTDDERRSSMQAVSARQLRLTLVRNGYSLASIDGAIDALPAGEQKDEALIEWEYATEFQRVSPTLNSIAAALAITPEQVDAMWSQALGA